MAGCDIGSICADSGASSRPILSLTSLAAESLGLGDEIGTVGEAYAADLDVAGGDPTLEVTALGNVRLVIRDGRVHRPRR